MVDAEHELRADIGRANDRITDEAKESMARDSAIQQRQATTAANIENLTANVAENQSHLKELMKVNHETQTAVQIQAQLHGQLAENHGETKKAAKEAKRIAIGAKDSAAALQKVADETKAKRIDWRTLGFYLLGTGIAGGVGFGIKVIYDIWTSKGG